MIEDIESEQFSFCSNDASQGSNFKKFSQPSWKMTLTTPGRSGCADTKISSKNEKKRLTSLKSR